jgi:hypothetical protein
MILLADRFDASRDFNYTSLVFIRERSCQMRKSGLQKRRHEAKSRHRETRYKIVASDGERLYSPERGEGSAHERGTKPAQQNTIEPAAAHKSTHGRPDPNYFKLTAI